MRRALVTARSSVKVRTRAVGPLARLAHDLELEATGASGWVDEDGPAWRAEFTFPVAGVRVVGVWRRGAVDKGVLSARDVQEIERRIRSEVFAGGELRVAGSGDLRLARLTVTASRGAETTSVALRMAPTDSDERSVEGRARLSLAKLGCREVRAPFGAFKVADEVEVEARLTFAAPR
ncbi:MAG: hypothetical protein FJ095_03700 [Deltaproteobacteria bacterium]|nr:hypothetical protein [Deltaproteobacteria bacterium]